MKNQIVQRPIKFRVWSLFNNRFDTKPIQYLINLQTEGVNDVFQNTNFVFQQFTGLLDKNGKEIFEGDIVKFGTVQHPIIGVVSFGAYANELNDDYGNGWYVTKDPNSNTFGSYSMGNECEIVGNIFETPELLKQNE